MEWNFFLGFLIWNKISELLDLSMAAEFNFHSFVEYLKREKWVYFDIFIWRHANGDEMKIGRHRRLVSIKRAVFMVFPYGD